MATAVLPKFSSATALTITLGSLASGSARQGTIVDNTTNRYMQLHVFAQIKMGTSPTGSTLVTFFLVRDDGSGSPIRTDGAGASDAAITLVNAVPVGTLTTKASPSTGDVLEGDFVIDDPGPKWTLAVLNGTGASLDSTNGNHVINWVGSDPEIQA